MSESNAELGIFDIRTPEAFFASALSKFKKYQDPNNRIKSTEDILYIIMVLTHLREWIAPGFEFSKKSTPKNPAEQFGVDLYNTCHAFKDLQALCNATKHLDTTQTEAIGEVNFDEWPSVDDVNSFDIGPPTSHYVNIQRGHGSATIRIQMDVCDLIETVIEKYKEWFTRKLQDD